MGRKELDYDEVLRYIGQFGTFQVFLAHQDSAGNNLRTTMLPETDLFLALACVCWRWTGCDGLCFHRYVSYTYFSPHNDSVYVLRTGLEPRYRCRVPECELPNSNNYTQAGREGLLPSWYIYDKIV